jgi:hypothetical protein
LSGAWFFARLSEAQTSTLASQSDIDLLASANQQMRRWAHFPAIQAPDWSRMHVFKQFLLPRHSPDNRHKPVLNHWQRFRNGIRS